MFLPFYSKGTTVYLISMYYLPRMFFLLLSSLIFYYILNFIEPPTSWSQASTYQILAFFLPLLALLTSLINLFLHQILRSFVASLGLMFTLVLVGDKNLTPLSAAITFFVTGIVFTYTPKIKSLHTHHLKKLGGKISSKKENHPEKYSKPPKLIKRL